MVRKRANRRMAKNETCAPIHPYYHTPFCTGIRWLLVGLLIGLNTYYSWLEWGYFIAGLIVLKALHKMIMPKCLFHK